MRKLLDVANHYLEISDWKTIAVLKFCLISLGLMIGMGIKKEHKKRIFPITILVFLLSYIPLMYKFYRVFKEEG